jgi:hypothetical protein
MIELPLVNGGIASVAFVDAIDSASSSDQMEEEADEWRALSRGRVNMESTNAVSDDGIVLSTDWSKDG